MISRLPHPWAVVAACAGALGLGSLVLAVQDAGSHGPAGRWDQRLAALRPTEVSAYMELAEDILDAARSSNDVAVTEVESLAKHLFGLAGALDAQAYGRSACLALADLTDDHLERERYLALAALLPGRDVLASWSKQPSDEVISPVSALVLSEALGFYRLGQGNRALSLLQRQSNSEVLAKFGHLLPGGSQRFLEDCKHYTNGRKPTIFEDHIARMLVLESAMLAGRERSWSGETLLSNAAPLIEIDPDRLDEMLGVDASKPYYVNGVFARVPAKE